MTILNCSSALRQLIETAHVRGAPDAALRAHLQSCGPCAERWEEQRALSGNFRILRIRTSHRRSSEDVRNALTSRYAARHRKAAGMRWLWSAAAAAVFLMAVIFVRDAGLDQAARRAAFASGGTAADAADTQEEGFIDVPYAPPLAEGELVRVVHTELQPAALATMGVTVDPSWTAGLPADLLVGQDGFPRAVRVSTESFTEGGF